MISNTETIKFLRSVMGLLATLTDAELKALKAIADSVYGDKKDGRR